MRICLVSREYPPDTGWGGIATFTRHLAYGLKELGHEVVVVSLAKDKPKSLVEDGITVHRVQPDLTPEIDALGLCIPYSKYVVTTSAALWQKFLELHEQQPFDVVDTPELLAEGLYQAVTKAAPLVIRLYTPHSKFIAERLHNVTPSFDHQFVALLERIAMLSADVITSPSDDLAEYVANDLNCDRNDIRIVRNPIDTTEFTPEGNQALTGDGRLTVLFVGRLEERKGINYLVKAIPAVVSKFSNVRFVIIGDDTNNGKGQRSVLAELKKQIVRSNCQKHVSFIDRVPLKELPDYYRSADISIVPSVYDNSPYTCLEAMACGKPVIGTTGGGTKEYIIHGESGIIVPACDSDALSGAMISLLQNADERSRLGAGARTRAVKEFQRTEIASQTLQLYKLARERFEISKDTALYPKQTDQALKDATQMLESFNLMICDLLYVWSWRFRLSYWWRLLWKRPGLFTAKLAVFFSRPFFSPGNMPPALTKLENEIRFRQLSAHKQLQLTTAASRDQQKHR